MGGIYIFFIRLILSAVFAAIISMFFFNGIRPLKTSILAAVMLLLAYVFEYTKKRDSQEKD